MTVHTCLCNLQFLKGNGSSIDDAIPKQQVDYLCSSQVDPTPALKHNPFSLKQLIIFKSPAQGKVVELSNGKDLEGVIGYYTGTDQDIIDDVVRLAAICKAAAVLVVKLPLKAPDVPVFKVPKGFMDRLTQSWKVSITVLRRPSTYPDDETTESSVADDAVLKPNSATDMDGDKLDSQTIAKPVADVDVPHAREVEGRFLALDTAPRVADLGLAHRRQPLLQLPPDDEENAKQMATHTTVHPLMDEVVKAFSGPSEASRVDRRGANAFEALSATESNLTSKDENIDQRTWADVASSRQDPVTEDSDSSVTFRDKMVAEKSQSHSGWLSQFFQSWLKHPSVGDVLSSKDDWTELKQYDTYISLSKKVKDLVDSKEADRGLDEMASEVHTFLNNSKGKLLHLVFAAQVVLTRTSQTMKVLAFTVLRQLSDMELTDKNRPSQFGSRDGQWCPVRIIFRFLNREFTSQLDSHDGDDRLSNLFCVWKDCGLFALSNIVDWERIRSQVDESFCSRTREKLVLSLGEGSAQLLRFFLCRSIEECLHVLFELEREHKRIPNVDEVLTEILLALIEARFREHCNNPEGLRGTLVIVHDILKHVTLIPKKNSSSYQGRIRGQFICSVVSLSSFRRRRSFQLYVIIVEVASPSNKDYDLWIDAARQCICEDMRASGRGMLLLTMDDVASLIVCDAFARIQNNIVFDTIISFSKKEMEQCCPIHKKLAFLGVLHRMFASVSGQIRFDPKRELIYLLRLAVKKEMVKSAAFEGCLQAATKQPLIFTGPPDLVDDISHMILSVDDGKRFTSNPLGLARSLEIVSSGAVGPLLSAFFERLLEVIVISFESINDAAHFYEQALDSSPKLIEIATVAFCQMFRKWLPRSFTELALDKSGNLASVFRCLSIYSANVVLSNENEVTNMEECAEQLHVIVKRWLHDFTSDKLSRKELSQILICCVAESWKVIADFCKSTELPTQGHVRLKCDEFDQSLRSIVQSISLDESYSTSVQDVLKGYNCFFDSTTQLGRIFLDYDFLLGQNDKSTARTSVAEGSIILCNVRDDARCAEAFAQNYNKEIKLCDYFLKNSSVLFRNAVSPWIRQKVDIGILSDALVKAKESIRSLFSPEADFEQVELAVRVVIDAERTLEQELSTLRASTELELTNAGIERFELISLLALLESHVKGFVSFCQQVKFAFVECDPLFNELKIVNDLLIERQQAPGIILESLRRVLCPRLSTSALDVVRKDLNRRLPALKFVACLSINIEVWVLAREMDWTGKEGIKRFHDEYANVTNVLLGNTETFEMAILDSLGSIIPAVALLASLTDAESLETFFDHIEKSDHIARCHVDGDFKDVKQVQCNVSSIRDWFTHGVDEISAVYGVFEAVKATGEYFIIVSNVHVDNSLSYELVLRYKVNGCAVAKAIAGKHLAKFVQDVGLIQHEVGEFVEQYRILSKASMLFSECLAAGNFEGNVEVFRCRAGSQSLTEAQDLLARAEASAKDFTSWLRRLRQTYPAALLFWTEELHMLHRHIVNIETDQANLLAHIRQMTSRLCFDRAAESNGFLTLTSVLELVRQDVAFKTEGWLVGVSRFVERLHGAMGNPVADGAPVDQTCEIVLHTIECDTNVKNLAILVLLQQIYKVRCLVSLP
jgi:hypothetical protein